MKVFTTIFFLIAFSFTALCQNVSKVSKPDSLKLIATWEILVKAIETKNKHTFKSISLELINCSYCIPAENMPVEDFFVPADTLIKMAFTGMLGSPLWKEIKENRFKLSLMTWIDFSPRSVPENQNKNLDIFGISFSFETGSFAEGFTYTFGFVKVKNDFKLFGLETVP